MNPISIHGKDFSYYKVQINDFCAMISIVSSLTPIQKLRKYHHCY